ncbi:MAG: LA2681 family HEPN domain-containing protein [Rhodocyclales bacterium]|nr:LA2681 family HEPN domain-containing protein [Rhodocyclales bacterium]
MPALLNKLALNIDAATNANDVRGLTEAIEEIASLDRSFLTQVDKATLDFYAANAFAGIRHATNQHNDWTWIQPSIESEVYHLRSALKSLGSLTTLGIGTDLKLRITTNLANALNHIGRFVEAIELWDQATSEHKEFSMAIGNRALALFWYARYVDGAEIQALFLKQSRAAFARAVALGVEDHANYHMTGWLQHLDTLADWDETSPQLPVFRNGRSKIERTYRKWCVSSRLVLNPANDLTDTLDSLQDTLVLPPITVSALGSGAALPAPYAIFNQLKQEFVAARFLVFEALAERHLPLHFADRGVTLYDALDYRCYRLWIEKLKMAFLSAYAILDKVAYLINDYWKLQLPIRSVTFNSIWFSQNRSSPKLSEPFSSSDNWPLRGLFSLSRDFYSKSRADRPLDPDAKILHEIRHHIAHKYLRVHDEILYSAEGDRARNGQEVSFPISEAELATSSVKLLKLVRSSLIYLSAAVAHEEMKRASAKKHGIVFPMPVTVVDDRYRI